MRVLAVLETFPVFDKDVASGSGYWKYWIPIRTFRCFWQTLTTLWHFLERNYDLAFERFAGEISKEKKKSERRIEKVPEPQRKLLELTKRAHPKDKAKSTEESLTMFETLWGWPGGKEVLNEARGLLTCLRGPSREGGTLIWRGCRCPVGWYHPTPLPSSKQTD